MSRVFIGIGSNEGDRLTHISNAIKVLAVSHNLQVVQMAPIIETEPVGGPPQGPYLNTVVELNTVLAPHELLGALKAIEQRLGRTPGSPRWGPRPIDLDILLYEEVVLNEPALTIPHPRMHQRRFVLEPLAQLAPDMMHPILRLTVSELLAQLPADSPHPVSP